MAIPIYNSRQLALRLKVNLARWKRWSREFLPPDPLAGMQAGYARQYYLDDAFQVYLGGHLLSHLRFSVPGARRVLADLTPWMREEGLRFDLRGRLGNGPTAENRDRVHLVRIFGEIDGFTYQLRQRLDRRRIESAGGGVWRELWAETAIGRDAGAKNAVPDETICRTLRLTALIEKFRSMVVCLDEQVDGS